MFIYEERSFVSFSLMSYFIVPFIYLYVFIYLFIYETAAGVLAHRLMSVSSFSCDINKQYLHKPEHETRWSELVVDRVSGSISWSVCPQVSSEVSAVAQSDAQTFTIGVLPQIPGFPQLAPDCDLQITVSKTYINLLGHHKNSVNNPD